MTMSDDTTITQARFSAMTDGTAEDWQVIARTAGADRAHHVVHDAVLCAFPVRRKTARPGLRTALNVPRPLVHAAPAAVKLAL